MPEAVGTILMLNVARKLARVYLAPISFLLDLVLKKLGIEQKNPNKAGIDDRLKRIDAARDNLKDVLEALDELHQQAEENKREAADAIAKLQGLQEQHKKEKDQLAAIQSIAEIDIVAFRKLAGTPSVGFERTVGFVGGILASLIASGLFALIQRAGWI